MPTKNKKTSIHGIQISRETALEGLGDPSTWEKEKDELRKKYNKQSVHYCNECDNRLINGYCSICDNYPN